MRTLWEKLKSAFGFSHRDDFEEEVTANLQMFIEDHIANGMTPEEARVAANRSFGNKVLTLEQTREAWTFPWLAAAVQDVRYGWRGLGRTPGFAAVVVLTLALGMGATTAIFSVVEAAALRPLPYPFGERLVMLGESNSKVEGISVTWLNFQHWREENHTFDGMAGYEWTHATLTGHGEPLFTRGAVVDAGFFTLTGAKPLLGRFFNDGEDRAGASGTVVLTHDFWAKHFSETSVTGSVIHLDGNSYVVTGVAPPSLKYFHDIDYYLPLAPRRGRPASRAEHGSIRLLARLREGVSLKTGLLDLNGIMQRLAAADPGPESGHLAWGMSLTDATTRGAKPTLMLLMAAAGLVLAIACANVASLVLSRSTKRAREMALRAAIGAGAGRLTRQLLTENLLIALIGGGLGVLLARVGLKALLAVAPRSIPGLAETSLNLTVLGFAAAVTLLTGVLVGLAPLWAARKMDLVTALNEGSRSATGGKQSHWMRSALVVCEIAVTLTLTYVSGLLIHSLMAAQNADLGFLPDRLLKMELVLPQASYPSAERQQQFYGGLVNAIRRMPGVVEAGGVNCAPSAGDCGDWFYSVIGKPAPARGDVPVSLFNMAEPGYFRAMHIPIKQGRAFMEQDGPASAKVAIVNEVMARKWWQGDSPIGQRIKVGGPYIDGATLEVVGVAGNYSQMGLDSDPVEEIFQPVAQNPQAGLTLMIRAAGKPEALMPQIRRAVFAQDSNLAIEQLGPFDEALQGTLARRKFTTGLLGGFAGLAVLLAAVGIYGLLNYWVAVRENDIAIRMALGAPRWSIARWTGWEALRLAAMGIALGVGGGLASSRLVESMVFGVPAQSPGTVVASAVFVVAIVMAAAAVPVWRAMRVDVIERLHRT